jgi:hypothetical protein
MAVQSKVCLEKDTKEMNQQPTHAPSYTYLSLSLTTSPLSGGLQAIMPIPNGQKRRPSDPTLQDLYPVKRLQTVALAITLTSVRSEVSQSSGVKDEEYEMKLDWTGVGVKA